MSFDFFWPLNVFPIKPTLVELIIDDRYAYAMGHGNRKENKSSAIRKYVAGLTAGVSQWPYFTAHLEHI